MLNPDKNYKRYRDTLHKTSTPLVPFLGTAPMVFLPLKEKRAAANSAHDYALGLYLSDLVFIETGNPDNLENNPNLINFRKCRMIARVSSSFRSFGTVSLLADALVIIICADSLGQVITELQSYQQMPYNLWPVEHLKKYLLSVTPMSEQAAFAASLIAEPRQDR